jgi:hypothetical protein
LHIAAIEAWGAPWLWANGESLAFWDELLRAGRRVTAVGGSDIHDLSARPGHHLATPTTWVPAGDDPLAAVRQGRVVVSQDSSGPVVVPLGPDGEFALGATLARAAPWRARVVGGRGGRLRVLGPEGRVTESRGIDIDEDDCQVDLGPLPRGWGRLELWGPGLFRAGPVAGRMGTMWCLTNPVYETA